MSSDKAAVELQTAGPGPVQNDMRGWVHRAIALLWVVQLVPWLVVGPGLAWRSDMATGLVAGSYGLYFAGAILTLVHVQRGRRFEGRDVAKWVAVMAGCELLVGFVLPAGALTTWANWTPAPSTGVALLARVVGGGRVAVATVALLGGIYATTGLRDLAVAPDHLPTIIGVVAQLAAFTYGFGLLARKLHATARAADMAAETALAECEVMVRAQERMRQYELLHTTVLTTLTLVARTDGLVTPELRARCAREAQYLRAVVRSAVVNEPGNLEAALAEAVFAQGALGLTIHYDVDELPAAVPDAVIQAVAHGVREALNNVVNHAGVTEAWMTAVGDGAGGTQIVITDRGAGFTSGATVGLGTTRSLGTQLTDVGATAVIHSVPGGGTSVEITWQPG